MSEPRNQYGFPSDPGPLAPRVRIEATISGLEQAVIDLEYARDNMGGSDWLALDKAARAASMLAFSVSEIHERRFGK